VRQNFPVQLHQFHLGLLWRCRGAVGPSIDLAALDEISVDTPSGRAEAENSTPQQ
jgi:hypothetical protein